MGIASFLSRCLEFYDNQIAITGFSYSITIF